MAPNTTTRFLPEEVAGLADRLGVTGEVDLTQQRISIGSRARGHRRGYRIFSSDSTAG